LSQKNQAGPAEDGLSDRLGEVARSLQGEGDLETMLDELVAGAIRLIPGAQEASLSVVTARRHVTAEHASSELAQNVDELQAEVEQGPGLDTIHEQLTVKVPDMRSEPRWPDFARRAHELGVGSMLSFQLFVGDDTMGALNLFSREADAFDDESEQIGLVFASHAAVAFANARKVRHLRLAIDSRDLIGQAKGVLMERYSLTADQAFAVLLRLSQTTQRKLGDLARELAGTGQLEGLKNPEQDAAAQR
jgi:transcriptional regulator with GAF, ATPase, and Fis domain